MALSSADQELVRIAFQSMDHTGSGLVSLDEICKTFYAAEHPRVKEGTMAPSAARDTLLHQFGACAAEHNGNVDLYEFLAYHERLADEANDEHVSDVAAFTTETIMRLWRLGDLLIPTGIRPSFPITEPPTGLYAATLMSLVWVERDTASGECVLKAVKDVVRPIFARGDLPEDLQGLFAFPDELAGLQVHYVPTQISIQRWLDVIWEYEDGKYCGVEGIVSARVDLDCLPEGVRQFIVEHSEAIRKRSAFVKTTNKANPMYTRSSEAYGYGVTEECRKLAEWKANSLNGKQLGLQYHGLCGKFFAKMKAPMQSTAATGMNV